MRQLLKISAITGAIALSAAATTMSPAAEVLVNGTLEESVSPLGWSISTSITGQPGSSIPALFEHVDGANQPNVISGQLGIAVKPQAGNQGAYDGQNLQTNLILEQTTANNFLVSNQPFTLTGWTFWGGVPGSEGYSGGVTTLHTGSPSDPTPENLDDPATVPSPTNTIVELAFLNNSNAVVGTPVTLDLRTVQSNDAMWRQFSIPTTAPVGSTKARVRVSATNMVDNFGFQDFYMDNFSLKKADGVERLVNNTLNTPGDPLGWTLIEGTATPDPAQPGTPDSASFINFAQHAGSSGGQGLWLRPYVNETQYNPDIASVFATLQQTVPAIAGVDYEFSAWTAWEWGFSGGLGPAFGTSVLLKMEFLNAANAVIGTETTDLYAAEMRNDQDGASNNIEPEDWRQFFVDGTAPVGTTNVRVSIDAQGMFQSDPPSGEPQSAFFDDFSLIADLPSAGDGDYNQDGVVDAADYVAWRKLPGSFGGDPGGYDTWKQTFGQPSPGAGGGGAVPEPATFCMIAIALSGFGLVRRRCA